MSRKKRVYVTILPPTPFLFRNCFQKSYDFCYEKNSIVISRVHELLILAGMTLLGFEDFCSGSEVDFSCIH